MSNGRAGRPKRRPSSNPNNDPIHAVMAGDPKGTIILMAKVVLKPDGRMGSRVVMLHDVEPPGAALIVLTDAIENIRRGIDPDFRIHLDGN